MKTKPMSTAVLEMHRKFLQWEAKSIPAKTKKDVWGKLKQAFFRYILTSFHVFEALIVITGKTIRLIGWAFLKLFHVIFLEDLTTEKPTYHKYQKRYLRH